MTGSAKWFTVLAFERFAEISKVTEAKLDAVAARIAILLAASTSSITYDKATDIAEATDEIVLKEIQSCSRFLAVRF